MKPLSVIFFIFLFDICLAQDPKELRHYSTNQHSSDFYISMDDKKVKYVDTLNYFWFKSQVVHVTQGYASGYLLSGPFTKYYVSGQLAESGLFDMGLQMGEWKTWHESGQLATIYNYENGVLDGNYFIYNESGKLIESGNYKSGKFHGEKTENGTVTEFKNGKEKPKREKKIEEEKEDSEKEDKEKKESIWKKWFGKKENKEDKKPKTDKKKST